MKPHALQLYDYHVWANQRVFEHLKELPKDIYHKEIQSVFSSISEVVAHIYATDTIWLWVMSGDSFDEIAKSRTQLRESTKGKGMDEMQRMFFTLSERYKAFFDRQENLDQSISPEHPVFGRLETNFFELVQHVVNHGTYHRGNITAMLRQLGYSGVMTDYVVYLYAMNTNK
ncbi:putative damage-inducible protein DinB [Neobacillus bataviensis]|uniref:Putative damage-inducible protein DinB n=1 Tax=Neobacillus bataviensis TaxID=220685 RepID=A0A561DC74_9BACI|nr:DinB family protein [Neobacillus bataviensis]TWE01002.1 putative damage-inducible protein DinB [Neobacillus bataviensis]